MSARLNARRRGDWRTFGEAEAEAEGGLFPPHQLAAPVIHSFTTPQPSAHHLDGDCGADGGVHSARARTRARLALALFTH